MYSHPTTNGLPGQSDLLALCRELTVHLTAYAISATHFDDEAFAACERAERLLFDAALGRH